MKLQRQARVLVSNDDGINAPGLRHLVKALSRVASVYVMAPSGERSASSHAITLGRYLSCFPADVPGTVEAFAVDGSPADSVMLALNSPVFKDVTFDLVASGINRGDNAGLHVIYSGTVGAAREAACKGLPAVALSLADHSAKQHDDYEVSASLACHIVESLLESLDTPAARSVFEAGCVVNVNFPRATEAVPQPVGLALTHQGTGCVFPAFKEVSEPKVELHTSELRMFRNYAGYMREDASEGSDGWAVQNGWVAVTPLSLRQDMPLRLDGCPISEAATSLVAGVVQAAACKAKLQTFGVPAGRHQQQQQQQPQSQQ